MTKQDELNLWKTFLDCLPAGAYLRDYLQDATPIIERDMLSDLPSEPIGELRRVRDDIESECKAARERLQEVKEQIRKEEATRTNIQSECAYAFRLLRTIEDNASELATRSIRHVNELRTKFPELQKAR